MAEPVRLQRYLATAGVAARRKAEELITAGRVTVNGAVVTVLGSKVDPEHDAVEVDGEAVVALDMFYVLFNKPKGCITAVSDDRGRPTVMDYLPNLPVPVKPVGRLDFYSEGVLLLTNDGELASRLLAAANHVPKTYHVKVHGQLAREDLIALREGITLDDGATTLPAEVEVLPGESKHTWLGITIHEGKHRQIHRMIEALGYQVDKLQRVAFANLTFHQLRVGDARELTQQELNELRDTVGLDHSSVARGRWRAKREDTDIPRRARAKAREEEEEEMAAGGDDVAEAPSGAPAQPRRPAMHARDTVAGGSQDRVRGADDRRAGAGPRQGPSARGMGSRRAPSEQGAGPRRGPSERGAGPRRGPSEYGAGSRRESSERGAGPRRGPSEYGAGPRQRSSEYGAGPRRGPSEYGAGSRRGPSERGAGPRQRPSERGAGPRQRPSERGAGPRRGPSEYGAGPRQRSSEYGAGPRQRSSEYGAGSRQRPSEYGAGPRQRSSERGAGPRRGPPERGAGPRRGPSERGAGPRQAPSERTTGPRRGRSAKPDADRRPERTEQRRGFGPRVPRRGR